MKTIHALAAAAALVAMPAAFASAADAPPGAPASLIVPGAHYQLVDAHGNVVGELAGETNTRLQLRPIGTTTALRNAPHAPATASSAAFRPDYSKALTSGQMSAAWQAELDRINPPFVTGGG